MQYRSKLLKAQGILKGDKMFNSGGKFLLKKEFLLNQGVLKESSLRLRK